MRPIAFACALAVLGVTVPAVAEDPPKPAAPAAGPAAMRRREKIAQPFLVGLIGAWNLPAPTAGEAKEPLGTVRWSSVLDGTALVEEASAGGSSTLSVLYVDAAGTGISVWRFHSENPGEIMTQKGTVSADGLELQGEGNLPGIKLEKSADALTVTRNGSSVPLSYVKSKDTARPADPAGKHPFLGSLAGDFATAGTMKMGDKEFQQAGTATVSATAGCTFSRTDYQALAGTEKKLGLGVAGLEADGKTFHYWWFTDHLDAPTLVSGEATDKEWKGKGEAPGIGAFEMKWTRTDAGFQIDAAFGGVTMLETFTRKKW